MSLCRLIFSLAVCVHGTEATQAIVGILPSGLCCSARFAVLETICVGIDAGDVLKLG